MRPALLLVDLQADFLGIGVQPSAQEVVRKAATLLTHCRRRGVPAIHVWTTVSRRDDRRMPHWKRNGIWRCEAGTEGHATPQALQPIAGEHLIHKSGFSPFVDPQLQSLLTKLGCDSVWLAGVQLHACIRMTALDAYQRGLTVLIADDAVGSDDPIHAAISKRYLSERDIGFVAVSRLCDSTDVALEPTSGTSLLRDVAKACEGAREAQRAWQRVALDERASRLLRVAAQLTADAHSLAVEMAREVGKPLRYAHAEVVRAAELVAAAARRDDGSLPIACGPLSARRQCPVGVISIITPWNNPLAIPLGKLAPALMYGNAVVWKSSPLAREVAARLMGILATAEFPAGLVQWLPGDSTVAQWLVAKGEIDAVSLTGSPAAGSAIQELCARRNLPLQAELGGNNAAIVWSDTDSERAAERVVEGAFGFAGQRCTATRRVIVPLHVADPLIDQLRRAASALVCGDPLDERTVVGPLVSQAAQQRVAAAIESEPVLWRGAEWSHPSFHPPVLVRADDPLCAIVQHETFGPVLVVQVAESFDQAIALSNAVSQGLVAALFSDSPAHRQQFLDQAQAGILKFDRATADADAAAPFGGWKGSGVGPPEHGDSNREFYTKTQALYRPEHEP